MGTLLEGAYLPGQWVRLDPARMRHLSMEQFRRYRCYHPLHRGRNLLTLTGRTDLACLTILRVPVERSISPLFHLQRSVREYPHTFTPEHLEHVRSIATAPLADCLDHPAFHRNCEAQTRPLGKLEDYTPLFQGSADAASGRTLQRPDSLPQLGNPDDKDQLLENARAWIETMEVVGTTENYAETLELVCARTGIPRPWKSPFTNANPERTSTESRYRSQYPSRVMEQIEELTRHDRQLYDFAREKFREQWSRHQAQPRRSYSLFPRLWIPLHKSSQAAVGLLRRTARRVVGR